MKTTEYFLDFQKLENLTNSNLFFNAKDKAAFKYEFIKRTYLNKPSVKFQYPVILYLGNKKFSMKYELEDILFCIKNGATKAETDYYRKHLNEFEINTQKQQFLNNLKSFTPCGIFYNRKSRTEIKQLNGIMMLQNIYESLTSNQLQLIRNEKLTFASFKLLDVNRFAILVKTTGMTSKNHKQFQLFLLSHYNNLLGINALNYTHINMSIPISFDNNIYVNNDCSILSGRDKSYKNSSLNRSDKDFSAMQ